MLTCAVGGNTWPANGGHANGRKLPSVFGAYMLNFPDFAATLSMKVQNLNTYVSQCVLAAINLYERFSEDCEIYESKSGEILFGAVCNEKMYWQTVMTLNGERDCRDPYQYIFLSFLLCDLYN